MQDEILKLPFQPLLCGEGVCGPRCEDTFVPLDTCFQFSCVLGNRHWTGREGMSNLRSPLGLCTPLLWSAGVAGLSPPSPQKLSLPVLPPSTHTSQLCVGQGRSVRNRGEQACEKPFPHSSPGDHLLTEAL